MLTPLDRKLLRDVGHMKGQTTAVVLVMACGLMMMITTRSLIHTLERTRDAFYQQYRMGDVFGSLKRAPLALVDRMRAVPGVTAVEPRVTIDATLDLPGMAEPATGHIISLPDERPHVLHRLFLRRGRLPEPGERRTAAVSEAFAAANRLHPGDSVAAVINGRRDTLVISGIVLSPEFVFEARAGETLPDNQRFGVFWMNERSLAAAYNMDGAFNDFVVDLAPDTPPDPAIAALDRLLTPYGALGAYTRRDHPSASILIDELRFLRVLAVAYPLVFLSVAAFMVNAVLARLVRLQREQIAQLKALGYSSWQVGLHFIKYTLIVVVAGTLAGAGAGRIMGAALVSLYRSFFHFPTLEFLMDYRALGTALAVSTGACVAGTLSSVRTAVALPPAEAMRPEPPAAFRPSWLERIGFTALLGPVPRMALRNIERRPLQAALTAVGLALATGLMVLPGSMADSIDYLLTYQWNDVQRQDVAVFLMEPASGKSLQDLAHLPGVLRAEPVRADPARLRHGHHARRLTVTGMPRDADLNRLLDARGRPIELPPEGLVMSAKLAEILGAGPGSEVEVEVLEGRRPVRRVPVRALVEDFAGLSAFMDIDALHRLMREGPTVSGAFLALDHRHWDRFMREVKKTPRAATVLVKRDQLEAFRKTTGRSIGIVRKFYLVLAVIVACGVVYNSTRIALSERNRDLATLRVLGFSRREVAALLQVELAILIAAALPAGLLFGRGLATLIIHAMDTETIRMPLYISPATYSLAVLVVLAAAAASFTIAGRMLHKLDLVGVLKARD